MEPHDHRQGYLRKARVESNDEPLVLESAHRHGVATDAMLHALRFATHRFTQDDGLTMFNGPDRGGTPVEVGVVHWHDGVAVIHAMRPARPKYMRWKK